ncbi:MAG: tRNA (N(6)-L-threonylcarbamoyladenosine(37)-C(2))-methylthiotransferase MtaB [Chlorobi bacterium]|nr:tRNA (N(6)-L-threonylcarbamoyladenosine(37)-C(2))-methylthiotransferase MtaB [Chlorobiota bacterium]
MKAAIYTFGCKQNYAESSSLARQLEEEGYTIVPFGEKADVVVINTCTVTETADRECHKIVRRALRHSPDAAIIVTGCYAQLQPDEIAQIEGVRMVVGNAEKHRLTQLLERAFTTEQPIIECNDDLRVGQLEFVPAVYSEHDSRTRAFLKLQDGCDYACAFCTIPHARGKSRSMAFDEIPVHVQRLANAGYREIVLTGINLGEYCAPTGQRLLDVLRLLVLLDTDCRFRLSSIEPNRMHPDIISFIADHPSVCPHFHLPLQSGSPEILRRMRRRYKRQLYAERVRMIKERIPHACIGADVLTGFPGESDHHFDETYSFIESLPISYLHVFTYSERERTDAVLYNSPVPFRVRKERTARLRRLGEMKQRSFYHQNIGTQRTVLVETYSMDVHGWVGYTENYCRVVLPAATEGTLLDVVVESFDGSLLHARGVAAHDDQPHYVALPVVA